MSSILELNYLNINGYQVNVVLDENNDDTSLCYLNLSFKQKNENVFQKWVTSENLHVKYLQNIKSKK